MDVLSRDVLVETRKRRYLTRKDDVSFVPGPYPADKFPGLWHEGLVEISRYAGVKYPLAGGLLLAAFGAAVQSSLKVHGPNNQRVGLNMNLLTIGRGSSNERVAADLLFKFLRDYQADEVGRRSIELEAFTFRERMNHLRIKSVERLIMGNLGRGRDISNLERTWLDIKRRAPILTDDINLIIDGGSPAKILDAYCRGLPVSIANISEVGHFIGSRSAGDLELLSWLIKSPENIDIYRKGKKISLKNVAFSQYCVIRSQLSKKYVKKLREFGQIGGPLVCDVSEESTEEAFCGEPLKILPILVEELRQRLESGIKKRFVEDFKFEFLRTLPSADDLFNEYFADLRESIKPGGYFSDVDDAVVNLKSNALKVAGIFHLMTGQDGWIDKNSMESALYVCTWYLQEFQRLFGRVGQISDDYMDAKVLEDWLWARFAAKAYTTFVKLAEIRDMGPRSLRSPAAIDRAKRVLEKKGLVTVQINKDAEILLLNMEYFTDSKIPARIAPLLKDFDYLHQLNGRHSWVHVSEEEQRAIERRRQ